MAPRLKSVFKSGIKPGLRWKLVAMNVPVVAAVILVLWLVIDTLAADYFSTLMEQYKISPDETHQMFLDAVHRYLVQASVVAMVIAVGLSFLFTRRALRPLSEMAEVTRRLSAGDYSARVRAPTGDEVGELGRAFNSMADSLERVENLRKTMVGDIAHELRTPLTNIRGYLEGFSDGVVEPSAEIFDMLREEILRLVRLVEDLQQLSLADAAKAYLKREELDLAEMVDQVLRLERDRFENRNIDVATEFQHGFGRVTADRDKMLQVLRNLIQNGWQYTPEGGSFRIAGEAMNGGVNGGVNGGARLSFISTGVTIDADDLSRIFERFYRVEKSRSRDSGGAGIGLAIVKELVEAHGGSVSAESGGNETRFSLTLPA